MFKFFKEKLKNAVSAITKKVEVEIEEEKREIEELAEPEKIEETKEKVKEEIKKEKPKKEVEEKKEKEKSEKEEVKKETKKKEKSIFSRIKEKITTTTISQERFEDLFNTLEIALLENNIAAEVIEKIKQDLKKDLTTKSLRRYEIEQTIKNSLKNAIGEVLEVPKIDLIQLIKLKEEKPYTILFLGVNGSGKTTTIGKLAYYLKQKDKSCIMVAADTFRAASIEQLQEHAKKVDVKLIKYDYGADPAAVAFEGKKYAQNKNIDVVLIDTAGRQQSNIDLMEEMKKIVRVVKPDLKVLVIDSFSGSDVIQQMEKFDDAVGIDSIIITKLDAYEKGGSLLSASFIGKKPILFLGYTQDYENGLKKYNPSEILESLGL